MSRSIIPCIFGTVGAGLLLFFTSCGMDGSGFSEGNQVGMPAGLYLRDTFENGLVDWTETGGATASIADDESGKHLQITVGRLFAGIQSPLRDVNSSQVKLAMHMRSDRLPYVGLNVFDNVARDNTTPYGYRYLYRPGWTPILYQLNRFRYNAQAGGFVGSDVNYGQLTFWSPKIPDFPARFDLDNIILYEGSDTVPPEAVTGLRMENRSEGVWLQWDAAQDNIAPMVYVVARANRDGPFVKITETCDSFFLDSTAGSGEFRYRVLAVDFEENVGPWSEAASIAATATAAQPQLTREELDRAHYAANVLQIHARGRENVRKGHVTLFGDSLTGAANYLHAVRASLLNLTVDAFGFASQRTSFAAGKIHEILTEQNPEFMLIMFGTNDRKDEANVHAAMVNLRNVIQACVQHGTIPVVATIPPRGFRDPQSTPEASYNQQLKALCNEMAIPVGYVFEAVEKAGPRKQFIAPDGVHWTPGGMELAGKTWGRVMDQVRFVLRDQPSETQLRESDATASRQVETAISQVPATVQAISQPIPTTPLTTPPTTRPVRQPTRPHRQIRVANIDQLQRALATAAPYTTILLNPGQYMLSRPLRMTVPNLTLRGVTGRRMDVILRGQSMSEPTVGVAISVDTSNITIADLTIGLVRAHGIQVRGENAVKDFTLKNVRIVDCGQQLLKSSTARNGVFSENCLVENCLFEYSNHAPSNYTNGVDVLGGKGWVVRGNTFRRIRGPASQNWAAGPALLFWRECHGTVVEQNWFIDCYRGPALGLVPATGNASPVPYYDHTGGVIRNNVVWNLHSWANEGIEANAARDVVIDHNTVFVEGSVPWSISIRFPVTNALVRNNLTNRQIILRDGAPAEMSGNLSNAQADWFTNLRSSDLRLASSNVPAVDACELIAGSKTDFRGVPRPQRAQADAGAYELEFAAQ